jgi:hypothetical protein
VERRGIFTAKEILKSNNFILEESEETFVAIQETTITITEEDFASPKEDFAFQAIPAKT